ncbi:MAG: glycine cleavage system aminomethyltransferase GcvT [Planctomycetaceae bacterium]|nr:glycine cleavage system aminomethyltransferase GcvT [Planctomycetaceae bacterium]
MDASLVKTPLYDWHVAHGGRMVDFAGWAMPVQYSSIIQEHTAIRSGLGIADISHMGRLRFEGPGAAVFLAELLTRRVADMALGQIRYSLVTNDQGGILDDVLVGYFRNSHGQPFFLLVVNASNRIKIVRWIQAHLTDERANRPGEEIIWNDVSRLWAMFAVQGPRSVELLQPLVDVDLQSMRYYRGVQSPILHPAAQRQGCIISRTGYTGEDGFEVSLGATIAKDVWEVLIERGQPMGLVPAGLGARDTLRLEAGMPLYGHELSEQINPFQAGLGSACHLVGYDFPGRDALLKLQNEPLRSVRVGLELAGKRAARQGAVLLADGRPIGSVTSGSYSPTLQKSIAMGYVAPEFAQPGTDLQVDIRGQIESARVVELPFYRRNKKGMKL